MAEYQGKTVKLNTPRALRKGETGHGKKRKVVFVKDPSTGRVKKITFGDANLGMHKGDKKRKKSYCARSAGMEAIELKLTIGHVEIGVVNGSYISNGKIFKRTPSKTSRLN